MTTAASSASSVRTLVMPSSGSGRSKSPPKLTDKCKDNGLTNEVLDIGKQTHRQSSIETGTALTSPANSPSHTPPTFPFYAGTGTQSDPYIVDWHGHDDPEDPHRWSMWWKGSIVATAALSTFCVAYTSSAYAGALKPLQHFLNTSQEVLLLGITLFVLGFALGPMFWAPLSEIFGRRPVILISYFPFSIFNLGSALCQTVPQMLVFRLLAGTCGSAVLTNGGGTISDLFSHKKRGNALAFFAVAPFLGPTMGPIISGFASESSLGWRSSFWIMTIFSFVLAMCNLFITRETYAPILLRKRASKLRKQHPDLHFVSKLDVGKDVRVKQRFKDNIFRPFQLLFKESIVASLSIYMAYLYALLYMCFASYPIVFQQARGWSPGVGGLAFLGISVGTILGNMYYYYLNGRYSHSLHIHQRKYGPDAHLPPEARLPGAIAGAVVIPIGLLIFAFTTDPSIHWIVPIASEMPFGAGQLLIFLCSTNYVLDAYTEHGASAMAANAILRSILGAVFPLFTTQMYHALGVRWASAIPAFVSLLGVPIPWILYKYGPRIRKNSKYCPSQPDEQEVTPAAAMDVELGDKAVADHSKNEQILAQR